MKRTLTLISLVLAFIMMFSSSSCNKENDENNKEGNVDSNIESKEASETKEKKEVVYSIYVDSQYGEELPSLSSQIDEKIAIKKASEKEFNISITKKSFKDETALQNRSITIAGKEYVLDYYKTYETVAASDKMAKFSKLGSYEGTNSRCSADFNLENSELVYFSDSDVNVKIDKELEATQANAKANSIVKELYGNDILNEYVLSRSEASHTDANERNEYNVIYQRHVYGIPTNDDIIVGLNMNCELVYINALGKGSLANAENDITKEELDKAIEFLSTTFSDGWSKTAVTLIVDSLGDYYITCTVWKGDYAQKVYINVQ